MSSKKKISPKKFLMEQLEKETEGNVILVEDKDVKIPLGKDLTPTEKIVLREHQGPHVERLKMIFEKNHCAFDMSTMGAGKTYTTQRGGKVTIKNIFIDATQEIAEAYATYEFETQEGQKGEETNRFGIVVDVIRNM